MFKSGKTNPVWVIVGLSAIFFVVFVAISFFLFVTQGGRELQSSSFIQSSSNKAGVIGILEINGVIMDSKKVLKNLEKLEESNQVKGIVIRLNSPGGAVGPSQEIYDAVKRLKKPNVASMGTIAASGAFYIAMGSQKVFSNPGAITGSIGVIMEFANLSKLYEWAKIQRYSIKTGKYKDAGSEYREMGPEERALLQGMVDNVLMQFKQAVAEGRKLSMPEVDAVADGRIFSGAQAKELKLVDSLGGLHEAIEEVAKMAGIEGKPKIFYPEKPKPKWMDFVMAEEDGEEVSQKNIPGSLVAQILGLGEVVTKNGTHSLPPGVYWLWSGAR